MNINDLINARLASTNRQAQSQENAANAAAQGQVGAARAASDGNVLSHIWSQPASFGSLSADIYGNYAGNTGAQGGNYANTYGAYTAGLGGLGSNASQNYATYAAGLGNVGNNYGSQATANSAAEAARQAALGNIASSALGAYGSGMNAAMGAYGLQQQAYNLAMGQAMNANQGALSALGQSRNNALAGLGNAYAGLGGSAAQLGGAGLQASQTSRTDNYQDQTARNRQSTGGYSRDTASMYGGGSGGYGGGYGSGYGGGYPQTFQASGPDGMIASGSYGGDVGSMYGNVYGSGNNAYDMSGSRNAFSETYGNNDSYARNTQRASQVTGPQMDAFRASLGAGMSGINSALGGLAGAQRDAMSQADTSSILGSYNSGIGSLNAANAAAAGVPAQMLEQSLGALRTLGGQGYNNIRRGMDQYYGAAKANTAAQDGILGLLTAGYSSAGNQLGGIGAAMSGGYGNAVRNVDAVRGDLATGASNARADVKNIYDGSVGNWMSGKRDGGNYLAPAYDQAHALRTAQAGRVAGEQIAHENAMREARQRGSSPVYMASPTGQIMRNDAAYGTPAGHTAMTGAQAAAALARQGAGPRQPVANYVPSAPPSGRGLYDIDPSQVPASLQSLLGRPSLNLGWRG